MNDKPTSTPTVEDFQALTRSSPWRFATVHFTHRGRSALDVRNDESVEAWLDRPSRRVTVRTARGVEIKEDVPDGRPRAIFRLPGAPADAEPKPEPEPRLRPDGLVAERPSYWHFDHGDPMWRDYQWTAMLDPYELSHGVDVENVAAVMLRDRLTWAATCRPLMGEGEDWDDGYDPRCGCCPLLDSLASRLPEYGPEDSMLSAADLPSTYRVWLDVRTAIVVGIDALDGHLGTVLTNEIHAVDEPLQAPDPTDREDPPVRSLFAVPGRLRTGTPPPPPRG